MAVPRTQHSVRLGDLRLILRTLSVVLRRSGAN
jgi:hypothetical protein